MIYGYELTSVVSPCGWAFDGRDAAFADCGYETGIIVNSSFDEALDTCDTVFFSESSIPVDFENMIYPKICKSACEGKDIICSINLGKDHYEDVYSICNSKGVDFKYYSYLDNIRQYINIEIKSEEINKIQTPVIFVLGIGENTNKFDIQLTLRQYFLKMGYKVSQIGTKHYCELLGFHSFPSFMYSNFFSESNKIVLYNHFVKKLEKEEQPDIIILGVPGGTVPYNNEFTNKFGIFAYEVSQAVLPDAVVFSSLYEDYLPEYFSMLSESVKGKFGYAIDCHNMSNVKFDWLMSHEERVMVYNRIDMRFIEQKVSYYQSCGKPVYNALSDISANEMGSFLLNKLLEYGDMQVV